MAYTYKRNASLKFFLLTFQDNVKNKEKMKNVLCMNCWMKFADWLYSIPSCQQYFKNEKKFKCHTLIIKFKHNNHLQHFYYYSVFFFLSSEQMSDNLTLTSNLSSVSLSLGGFQSQRIYFKNYHTKLLLNVVYVHI